MLLAVPTRETEEATPAFMTRMIRSGGRAADVAPVDQPTGFAGFFEAEYRRLARALYLVVGDPEEAEDVAQEAMVRVCERWARVRGVEDPIGYLYRTALNLYRSRLRRLAVRARRLIERPTSPDPALEAEAHDSLERALASLPDGQRAAVVLVGWVGLSTEDAGRVLGIEPVSVRVRLSRARAALREALGERHD
jgi:RNA polymerase sigma factor (sigma-70 family)